MKKPPVKLTKTQQKLLDIIGQRYVFDFGQFFSISEFDGRYRHGYYDRVREDAAKAAHCTIVTWRALQRSDRFELVTWFKRDATGNRGHIYRPVKT